MAAAAWQRVASSARDYGGFDNGRKPIPLLGERHSPRLYIRQYLAFARFGDEIQKGDASEMRNCSQNRV